MIKQILEYIEYIITLTQVDEIYICVDGIAPMAKIVQQRLRRYKSVHEIKERQIELLDQNIPVAIPMRDGFYGKSAVSYIITDVSNKTIFPIPQC